MITKTLTSLLTSNIEQNIFYRINDTFLPNNEINFSCPVTTLNSLLGSSISSFNISSYKLYVRICDNISGASIENNRFTYNFNLSSSNIINNSVIVNLTPITNNLSHEYLCDNMSLNEIFSLYKNFKIIFRIYQGLLNNENLILASDIVQDLNIVLNTAENGPYNVGMKELDILSPLDFTQSELTSIYTNKSYFLGAERVRAFYPENIEKSSLCPVLLFSHGNGQFTSSYDIYFSLLASYGYVVFSITSNPSGSEYGALAYLNILDHIKKYQEKINSGFLSNLINFNKINFSGHSRGGGSAFAAFEYLDGRSFITSMQDITIDIKNIKSIISFADAYSGSLIYQNKIFNAGSTFDDAINDNYLRYYDLFIDTPVFYVKGTNDGDSAPTYFIGYRGCTSEYKRNKHDIVNISVENYGHGELSPSPFFIDQLHSQNELLVGKSGFPLKETYTVYNTQFTKLSEICSEIIFFLAIQNFNSTKIKKLYYQDINLLDKKILKTKQSGLHRQIDESYNSIKYGLDYFHEITSSYAGQTGMTFSAIGFTYGYALDDSLFATSTASITYNNAVKTKKIISYSDSFLIEYNSTDNDTFNGIINLYDKCLFLPIESDFSLGYTFSSGLTFEENDYFCLRGALKILSPYNLGNTMNCHFQMSLYDNLNNISSLSSKTSNQFFNPPYNPFNYGTTAYNNYTPPNSAQPIFIDNVYFRAGDFYLNNPSLNLNNIRQILLNFGPSYGSTFAHLVLDEFVVTKSL